MKYTDIDKKNNQLHISRTLKYVEGKFAEDTPKSKTSIRDIPLTDNLIKVLDAQRNYCLLYTSVRDLQECIFQERCTGAIICSGSGAGYWLPKDKEEIRKFCETMEKMCIRDRNMTPNQVKGIITRAGKGTKIVLLGDPN